MLNSKILVASLIVFGATFASAQTTPSKDTSSDNPRAVQPERPTVATHAFTVAPGYLEIEAGGERDQITSALTNVGFPVVLKIGLADRAQLSINLPLVDPPFAKTGIGDVSVGIKYRVVDDAPVVGALAFLPSVKAPTGSDVDLRGTGTTDVSLLAISSHKFGDYSMDVNVEYTHRSAGSAPSMATLWTVAVGGPFVGAFGWNAECYGYPGTGGAFGQPPIVAILAGPTLLARETLAFDAGVIIPVKGPQPHAVYAGLVYNVGRILPH